MLGSKCLYPLTYLDNTYFGFLFYFIETRSEDGLELLILLPAPPRFWDHRCALSFPPRSPHYLK